MGRTFSFYYHSLYEYNIRENLKVVDNSPEECIFVNIENKLCQINYNVNKWLTR